VANSTAAIDVLPSSRRNEGLGFYGLSNNLSMAIAPSAGVFVYKLTDSFSLLFWLSFIVALGAVVVASTIKLPARALKKVKRPVSLDRFFLTRAWLLSVNIMFFAFSWGLMSCYIALYSQKVLAMTSGTGTFFMLISIGLIASRLQGAKALREGKLTRNAAEGMCISLVGYFLFIAFPSQFTYYAAALLVGLGNGHLYPAFLNMFVATARHDQRGTANSSILVSWGVGMGIGILSGGMISGGLGYSFAFWVNFAVNAVGVVLYFAATRRFFLLRRIEQA
jgi:predicted MFS family arabinose efflux permease